MYKMLKQFNSMMKLFRETALDLFENRGKLIASSVFFHMFSSVISTGLLWFAFRVILSILNKPNINFSNFFEIISNPIAILLFSFYLLFMAFVLFFEFSLLIFLAYSEKYKKPIRFRRAISNAFSKVKSLISPQILIFALYFISLIPLSGFIAGPFLLEKIKIPQFIFLEISKNIYPSGILAIFLGVIFYLNYKMIFTLPILMLGRKKNLLQSIRLSWRLSKGQKINILGSALLFEVIINSIIFTFYLLLNFISRYIGFSLFSNALIGGIAFVGVAISKIFVVDLLLEIMAINGIIHDDSIAPEKDTKKNLLWLASVGIFSFSFVISNLVNVLDFQVNEKAKIIAHRGFTKSSVENSIDSLRMAKKAGADFVETDVQMTVDGKFVIFHDDNLSRLAGVRDEISQMTLDKVKEINIKQNKSVAKIPTLEEFASESKKLNINIFWELKPSKNSRPDFLEKFIEKIDELNLKRDKFMSINKTMVEELDSRRPDLNVGAVIPFQFGDFDKKETFDFYVIEESSFDEKSTISAMLSGKEIYIWTVNDLVDISKYFKKQNSGIITDESSLAHEIRKSLKDNKNY